MAVNYFDNSTVDGVKYLSRKNLIERIFWIICLLLSTLCTLILIVQVVLKMETFRIVTYSTKMPMKISDPDFPAVTICSGLASNIFSAQFAVPGVQYEFGMYIPKLLYPDFYSEFDVRLNISIEDYELVGDQSYEELLQKVGQNEVDVRELNSRMYVLIGPHLRRLQVVDLVTRQGILTKKNLSIPTDNFLYTANEFEKFTMSYHASVNFHWIQDDTLMSEIMTEKGFCFSFNLAPAEAMLDADTVSADLMHEYFFVKNAPKIHKIQQVFPKTINVIEFFDFFFNVRQDFYDSIRNGIFEGHFVYIHDPYELPIESLHPYPIHPYLHTDLYLEPIMLTIDDSLKDLTPHERSCYVEGEKNLKFFKIYTKTNCEHECLSDFMLDKCGCVEFFMVRNYTTRICSVMEKDCFDEARNIFENSHVANCDCLQPCTYVKYSVVCEPKNIVPSKFIHFDNDTTLLSYNRIKTSIPPDNYLVRKREFNEFDLMSSAGGVLGLFAGFSSVSFIEVAYWMFKKVKARLSRTNRVHPEQDDKKDTTSGNKHNIFQEYFSSSSIHGVNYMFSANMMETIFWFLACGITISTCFALISLTKEKLPDSLIVSMDDNLNSIEKIPFPAITYKPSTFVRKMFKKLDESVFKDFVIKLLVEPYPKTKKDFLEYLTRKQYNTFGLLHTINHLGWDYQAGAVPKLVQKASRIDYMKQQDAMFNNKYAVEFAEVQLYADVVYTFNLVDADKIYNFDRVDESMRYYKNISMLNSNKLVKIPKESQPIHMSMQDILLEFKMKVKKENENYDDKLIMDRTASFSIHEVDVHPSYFHISNLVEVRFGFVLIAEVTPVIFVTDQSLRKLRPQERECYFEDEYPLKYFNSYSYDNCQMECLVDIIFNRCGCITTIEPFLKKPGMRYCHTRQELTCGYETQRIISNYTEACQCLQKCDYIDYNVQYRSDFYEESENESVLIVRMRTDDSKLYRRHQQFTLSDVISYVGGLLTLFAGISALSVVEIVYFFFIRVAVNFCRCIRI